MLLLVKSYPAFNSRMVLLITSTLFFCCASSTLSSTSKTYHLKADSVSTKTHREHLKMGGSNPQGDSISFTNYYMEFNGLPVMPVMGEFHFSRYPAKYWEEEILKMKAGGLDVIPTYVFWSIHEEEQGVFNWSGDRNLRRFVELCAKNNIWTIIRIGPFCHGEIRNGGLPDWLYGRPFQVRSNDKAYLKYVARLYKEIGRQLEGLMFKNGGPVIGIQLENEYMHSASPWALTYPEQPAEWTAADMHDVMEGVGSRGKDWTPKEYGIEHMKTLKRLAIEAGLIAPIYTATGWGGAATIPDETLPVTAAYAYPNWADIEMSPFYLFKDIQKKPDYPPALYDTERYPVFCAEMGGGMMVRYSRRPTVPAASLEAIVVRAMGSGANAIGYYMYHGGSTPIGKHSFLSDEAYGYPKISYDFQAPIREFGQLNESYHRLKILHLFMNEFGSVLAPMRTVLPNGAEKIDRADTSTLRFAARVKDNSGFLFLINFQDHCQMEDIENIKINLQLPSEELVIPKDEGFTLKKEVSAIFPFNFLMDDVLLKYATAQLLTKIENKSVPHYFFFATESIEPEFVFNESTINSIKTAGKKEHDKNAGFITVNPRTGETITLTKNNGSKIKITTLARKQAINAWKTVLFGKEHLIISESTIIGREKFIEVTSTGNSVMAFSIYPDIEGKLESSKGKLEKKTDGIFVNYQVTLPKQKIDLAIKRVGKNRVVVNFPENSLDGLNDIFLEIDYIGDTGMAFIDGRLINDNLYDGSPWYIGIKRFAPEILDKGFYFYCRPIYKEATYLRDLPTDRIPDFSNGPVVNIKSIRAIGEYKVLIKRRI